MKFLAWVGDKLLGSVISIIVTATIGSVIAASFSRIKTGQWFGWLGRRDFWFFVVIIILVAVIARLYSRQQRDLNTSGSTGVFITPPYNWVKVGEIQFEDVMWIVRAHAPDPYDDNPNYPHIESHEIDVESTPHCSNCSTEMDESKSVFGGFFWHCPNCKYQKRSSKSFVMQARSAAKVARNKPWRW